MANKKIICPTCKQDMNDLPHAGMNDKDRSQCGQGLHWKQRAKKDKDVADVQDKIVKEYLK